MRAIHHHGRHGGLLVDGDHDHRRIDHRRIDHRRVDHRQIEHRVEHRGARATPWFVLAVVAFVAAIVAG